jgi:trk system potassium uptake protein TrkA
MREKVLIVGAGQFGRSLAREMARRDLDVTVLDPDENQLAGLVDIVSRTLIGDGTDQKVLESLDPETFGVAVDAIGEEALQSSILCAALLVQLGFRRIVARMVSELHGRILRSVGVHEIVHPESYVAEALARRVAAPGVRRQLELENNVFLVELEIPEAWIGKSLRDLGLRQHYDVTVVAMRGSGTGDLVPSPPPEAPLGRGAVVMVLGTEHNVERILKEHG